MSRRFLLLALIGTELAGAVARAGCSLQKVLRPNPKCPVFVHLNSGDDGLGDQLQRLFALLALACHTGYTAVVSDNFGEVSEHQSHGYAAEFEFLGIPLKFLRMSAVEERWEGLRASHVSFNKLIHQPRDRNSSSDGCLRLIQTDIHSCYNTWCPLVFTNQVYYTIAPILEEMKRLRQRRQASTWERVSLIRNESIIVVWHMRHKGNMNPHLRDTSFYTNALAYLSAQLAGVPLQHYVIGSDAVSADAMFPSIAATGTAVLMPNNSVLQDIDLMLGADIIVTTGSSFPTTVTWLSEYDRPIILEAPSKDASVSRRFARKRLRERYYMPEGRSIRLQEDGTPLSHYLTGGNDVLEKLQESGRLAVNAEKDGALVIAQS